ncbi:peptide chain release factor 1 [bacterium]|jgi:peptide chain release factor 1|nr:peptide chain release factor 1 [bacterium]MDP6571686.1 peptide chain release factor 1 [Patescibacteria group bacterium]|tara:strand:- start:16031 stop:17101 length:1071 start_codon:yes stop_codon:yes gene_type:complete
MIDQIKKLKSRLHELEKKLQSPEAASDTQKLKALSQEYSDLKDKTELADKYESTEKQLTDAKHTKQESDDAEMIQLAEEEIQTLTKKKTEVERELTIALLPQDPNDKKNIIIEIRAAAGGDESALFAAELFRMYSQYAEEKKWQTNLLSTNRIGIGGFKEVTFEIKGLNAYSFLKYESGVHRVQRVPETEKSGRVHTSTVTVAVMPEAEEQDSDIDPKDLKIETSTSTGHGGQSVNTTYSAIRMVHIPTGITVSMQDEKSQQQNRIKAMTVMRTRVNAHYESIRQKQESDTRRSQIGTGDRSEKIRTYNFPQDRITDHRIKKNWSNIDKIMDGEIDPMIVALRDEDIKQKLSNTSS